jgi:hypothetical protein
LVGLADRVSIIIQGDTNMIPEEMSTNQQAFDRLLARLNTVIENQEIIKANQEIIKVNQEKLDAILANQNTIQANQAQIISLLTS